MAKYKVTDANRANSYIIEADSFSIGADRWLTVEAITDAGQ